MCKALQTLLDLHVDGLLVVSGDRVIPKRSIMEVWSQGVPLVCINAIIMRMPLDNVITDEKQLAETAIDYLNGLGHRKIAYIGHLNDYRMQAVLQALRQKGLAQHYFGDIDADPSLTSILARWRALPSPPTAVLAYSDSIAVQFLQLVTQEGIHVPHDLSVLGCANLAIDEYSVPPLTSIEQHPIDIGRRAFDLLLQRIESECLPSDCHPELIQIPTTLIERGSCSAPRSKRRL